MKAERLLLELLFEKLNDKTPPTKKTTKPSKELTAKQMIKLMKALPEFKKEFEGALKALEPEKKDKDKLTIGQKYMLVVVATATVVPVYVVVMGALFKALTG